MFEKHSNFSFSLHIYIMPCKRRWRGNNERADTFYLSCHAEIRRRETMQNDAKRCKSHNQVERGKMNHQLAWGFKSTEEDNWVVGRRNPQQLILFFHNHSVALETVPLLGQGHETRHEVVPISCLSPNGRSSDKSDQSSMWNVHICTPLKTHGSINHIMLRLSIIYIPLHHLDCV